MSVYYFWAAVLIATVIVLAWGDGEQRLAILVIDAAFILSAIFFHTGSKTWLDWPIGVLITDTVALCMLTLLALRSKRFWPLPIAALMVMPVITPLISSFGRGLVSDALGWTQGIWGDLQLLILVVVAWRHRRQGAMAEAR